MRMSGSGACLRSPLQRHHVKTDIFSDLLDSHTSHTNHKGHNSHTTTRNIIADYAGRRLGRNDILPAWLSG